MEMRLEGHQISVSEQILHNIEMHRNTVIIPFRNQIDAIAQYLLSNGYNKNADNDHYRSFAKPVSEDGAREVKIIANMTERLVSVQEIENQWAITQVNFNGERNAFLAKRVIDIVRSVEENLSFEKESVPESEK